MHCKKYSNKAVQFDNLRAVCLVVSLSLNFTTSQTAHKLRLTAALAQKRNIQSTIMPSRNRQRRKKLQGKNRMNNAEKWLMSRERPQTDIIGSYAKRYAIELDLARDELISLGLHDEVFTEEMEKQGKKVEYIVNPLTGELVLVEAGTEEHELFI